MTVDGIAAVHQRVAMITAQFAPIATRAATSTATRSADRSLPGTGSFAEILSQTRGAPPAAPPMPAAPSMPAAASNTVIAAGSRYLGVPYLWGGTDPAKGLDCSGFVQRTFRDL